MAASTESYDLVVVGGGLAGLTAAVRATELGLRALVLEQGDGVDYPCNSRHSGGILHIGFHDPFRPAGELIGIIGRITGGEADTALATALSGTGGRLITWLQDKGARFMRFNQLEGYRWCMAPPRALRAGLDWKERGPDKVLRALAEQLVAAGGRLQLRTRARSLVMEGGACVGVEAESGGQTVVYRSQHVLLADGGFQTSRDLYQTHIGPNFERVFQRGARTGRGDGLTMAVAAGARLVGTERFYGHLLCRDALHNDQVWPYPELDAIATAGIVVDESGTRFADEGRSGVYLANALATQTSSTAMHVVFDAAIWDGPGTSARIPANPLLERAGGTVHRADTIEGLARLIGVPPGQFAQTVADYNAAQATDRLEALAVPRSKTIPPLPIHQPPFMAIPVCPGITYTMGGIAIDRHAQVLRADGQPIKGLLAAGATTGGLEGGRNAAYVGGLIKAGVFGLLAAERAAELQNKGQALDTPNSRETAPRTSTAAAALASSAPLRGLARFPVLHATLRFGKVAACILSAIVALLTLWLGWSALSWLAVPLAALAGLLTAYLVLSYTELIRLITELLIPD